MVPIHEDQSPVDFEYGTTLGPLDSIDLLQSPAGSDELTPNLAVIQELEEIRNLIELKSRDLSKQEALLSQSLDQLHIHHARGIDYLKGQCDEWTKECISLVERRFEKSTLRINKLLGKLDDRIKDFQIQKLKHRLVQECSADVPPLPDVTKSPGNSNLQLFRVLSPGRFSRSPLERQFAFAILNLLMSPRMPSENRGILVSMVFEYFAYGVDASLNHRFLSTIRESTNSVPESRFDRAKKGVVVKRLGLGETRNAFIDISMANVTLPQKFEVKHYLEDTDVRKAYEDALTKYPTSSLVPSSFFSFCLDSCVSSILKHLLRASRDTDPNSAAINLILVRALLSNIKDVDDNIRPLCHREFIDRNVLNSSVWLELLKVVVFIVDRIGPSMSDALASQFNLILENMKYIAHSRSLFSKFMEWKHGICWLMHYISKPDQTEPQNSVSTDFIMLLEELPNVSEIIQPWRDTFINIMQATSPSDKAHTRIKLLLRLTSYS